MQKRSNKNKLIVFGFLYFMVFVLLVVMGIMVGRVERLYANFGADSLPFVTKLLVIWNKNIFFAVIIDSIVAGLIALPSVFLQTKWVKLFYLLLIGSLVSFLSIAIYLPIYQLADLVN